MRHVPHTDHEQTQLSPGEERKPARMSFSNAYRTELEAKLKIDCGRDTEHSQTLYGFRI